MLQRVDVEPKSLRDYESIAGEGAVAEIRKLAEPFKGARVLHINSTSYGGGVAEILRTMVPLLRDAGLDAEWQVIVAEKEFFTITKNIHNALQGHSVDLDEAAQELYLRNNRLNAELLEGEYDFIVVHDPQPAALLHFHGRQGGKHWIWRCHIDTSTPFLPVRDFLRPFLLEHDAVIYTMAECIGVGMAFGEIFVIPPSIDPLSPKNLPLTEEEARSIVGRFGIDLERPLLVQVSRFDPWKDPLGVIDAYRRVKEQIPEVQLALIGSMAADDPEGLLYYAKSLRRAGEDFDVHILSNFDGVYDREVNAFQTLADIIIQKSVREGFGLVVAEALWKKKPVLGGRVGGIPLQIIEGETGYLMGDTDSYVGTCLYLLRNRDAAKEMGKKAKEHVRQNFLSTRHVRDYLNMFHSLIAEKPLEKSAEPAGAGAGAGSKQ